MQVAVAAALQQHLLEPPGMPMCLGKRAALDASGSCLCLVRCLRDRGLWGTPQDCVLSMGLWDSAKVDFHHSWDCACRFCSLCSPAALRVMNDTCMGPFSSIKSGQLTAYHVISIKFSYFPNQGGQTRMTTIEQSLVSAESPVMPGNCFGKFLVAQAKIMSATALMTSVPVPWHHLI